MGCQQVPLISSQNYSQTPFQIIKTSLLVELVISFTRFYLFISRILFIYISCPVLFDSLFEGVSRKKKLFMDSDFWVSRLAAAKRQFFNHHKNHLNAHLDRLIVDEMDEDEDDDEMGYPCPYCYVEFDLIPLCHHLEHEHYDETAETVCTICADKISGDMLRHITTEHEPLFKIAIQQNRLRKISNPRSQELSLLGRDLRAAHLKTLLAGKGQQQSSSGVSDSLLSSVLNYPTPGVEEISKLVISCAEDSSKTVEPAQHIWQSSFDPTLSSEEREKRTRQAAGKAAFVQDLVCSTMFKD